MGFAWMCLGALLASLLAAWAWLWSTRQRTSIPGPPTVPLLGNVLHFRKLPTVVEHLRSLQRQYGDVFRFYVGPKLFVVVTTPEDVQKVLPLSKQRDPFFVQPFRTFIGDGLLTSHGRKWREHRRVLEPAFRKEVVNSFIDIFNDTAEVICKGLEKTVGSEQEVHKVLFYGTLRTLVHSSFGFPLEMVLTKSTTIDELTEMLTFGLEYTQRRVFQPWLRPDWSLHLFPDGRKCKRVANWFHDTIRRGFELLTQRGISGDDQQLEVLADVLMGQKGGKTFAPADVLDEMCTFMIAGTDTSAVSMSCVLTLLALYPEWQDRAVEELNSVFGGGGDYQRPPTVKDLDQLVLLDSLIKEAMRLFASVPVGPYVSSADITLDSGHYIPTGSCVFVAYYLLHRHPEHFPNPDQFDPRRFLEEGSSTARHPYSYLPFGGGPRKCPGYRYALVQLKAILSAVLRRFRFLPGSTREELEDLVLSATIHPITGYRVTCVPREPPELTNLAS